MAKKKPERAVENIPQTEAEYKVIHPILHDDTKYKRGETISLIDSDAKPLVAAGVLKPIEAPKTEVPKTEE